MDDRAFWIWLQHAFGEGSPMPWRIHQSVPGGVEGFYHGGPRLWNSLDIIREKDAAALYSFPWKRPRPSWNMPSGWAGK